MLYPLRIIRICCRSAQIRYMVSCTVPTTNIECPPTPSWTNVRSAPVPRDLISTIQGNSTTTQFTVQAGCKCSEAYWGMHYTAAYRYLPLRACGL
jgi:hypothetical protein